MLKKNLNHGNVWPPLEEEYPLNLLRALDRNQFEDVGQPPSEDIINGLEHAVSMLDKKEQEIVRCRYLESMTRAQTAEVLGISLSTVSTNEGKAIRKLRHPSRYCFIRNGLKGQANAKRNEDYARGYEDGYKLGYNQAISDMEQGIVRNGNEEDMTQIPLSAIGMGLRPFNILYRYGYRTVSDIITLSREEIRCLHGMGYKSYASVANALNRNGIRHTNWDEYL